MNKRVPPPVSKRVPPPIPGRSRKTPPPPGGSIKSELLKRGRPPLIPILCAVALVFLEVWFVLLDHNRANMHLLASIIGLLGSVVLLGWFRQSLNLSRSTSSFSDWSGPFESTTYMSLFVIASWILGVINLYFSVYEKLRP